jgi:hypothetical protein
MMTRILLLVSALSSCFYAKALDLSTYAENSVLNEGKWVKIGVETNGLYMLTNATLRSWGFTDPSRVRIYGYGGKRIADVLSAANYIDDLPLVQSTCTSKGVVFYGVGAGEWVQSTSNRYHWNTNVYTTYGYYFVTESDITLRDIEKVGRATAAEPATTFNDYVHHEQELTSPGEAGPLLVGEDFRYTPSRKFSFTLPDRESDTNIWFECSFVAKTNNQSSSLTFTLNGTTLTSNSSDVIRAVSSGEYYHGAEAVARHETTLSGNTTSVEIGIKHSASTTVLGAWLNYLTVNYTRSLKIPTAGYLNFRLFGTQAQLANSSTSTHVWDVTNPQNIYEMNTAAGTGSSTVWTNDYTGLREYAAWNEDASIPAPTYIGTVTNQNLHATENVDMVIFTHTTWQAQAERLAELHRNSSDSLKVAVVNVNDVYNEFASGSGDISAMRKYLKMLYDRSLGSDHQLRFALMIGRMTYDNRQLTSGTKSLGIQTIPSWGVRTNSASLSDNDGYCTDDFLAMLEDGSGSDLGLDYLSIAVGRIPSTSLAAARETVDKIEQYIKQSKMTQWKQRILFLADDDNSGVHMTQTESMIGYLEAADSKSLNEKVYIDAYQKTNGNYPQAREVMFRYLNDGVVWWNFVGHANNHAWTHDGQLTFNDINNLYLRNIPFVYAATCDFLRWDSNTQSGGEILFGERYGGCIGMVSAIRPVYITENGYLTSAMGRALGTRDESGRLLTSGEIYQHAKNDMRNDRGDRIRNENRLRYVFMGDPALRLAMPSNIITLDSIDDKPVTEDNQITLEALGAPVIKGSITAPNGTELSDFNGLVNVEIYDAEQSITTNGNGDEGVPVTFETYGNKIYAGSAQVTNGKFSLQAAMPSEIANNFRPATMALYAYSTEDDTEAIGLNKDFYIYGFNENAVEDTEAPTIDSFVLNHSSFKSGDKVNNEPMVIASVSDNIGINVSLAGIGHQMALILDDNTTYTDVTHYYTPGTDERPSGTINYPLSDLANGNHTLKLRVWDTSGNSASETIEFYVMQNLAPTIYSVYTDANPASTVANFYITHDRPDCMVTVAVTVYDLLGRPVWTGSQTGMSDMFTSVPVTWNLTDNAGRRVNRGIYIYRASITTDDETFETASRRIAVTAQ